MTSASATTTTAGSGSSIGHLAYRPWVWFVYIPFLLLSTAFWGSIAVMVSLISHKLAFRCGTLWARGLMLANFTRLTVHGRQHLAAGQAYVIMPNHSSLFDIPALASIWQWDFRWVMKQELRRVPFLGPACAAFGNVFVDRHNRNAAIASLRDAQPMFARGTSLLIFPEGRRSRTSEMLPLKKGGFMVALDAGLPILPVTVANTQKVLPNDGIALMPGHVVITIHPPIDPGDYGVERRDELMRDVARVITAGHTAP